MQEKQQLSERLLMAIVILLGAGIVIVAFALAINPDILSSPGHAPRPKIQIEDFKLDNYRGSTSLDDEKTNGTTNQIIDVFKRRNAVEVPALDLMDLDDPSKYSTGETVQMSTIAPITTPTR